MITYSPYWWQDCALSNTSQTSLQKTCDVAIIGAGYAGLSAAIELARAGRSVQIIDRGNPGEAASTRSGGIASGNLRISFSSMINRFGLKHALAKYGEGVEARRDLLNFIDHENIECQLQKVGRYTALAQPQQYEQAARDTERLNQHFKLDAFAVPRSEQQTEIGSDIYHGGIVRPDICGLHPAQLHRGMLQTAQTSGVLIHGHTTALGIQREAHRFHLNTDRGSISASHIIVCTNGYTDGATPWLQRRLVPVPSLMIATEALAPDLIQRLFPKQRMYGESRHIHHYYRPSPDGSRVLIGGRTAGRLTVDGVVNYTPVYKRLGEIFPELHQVKLSHVWWGYVAMNLDHLPQLAIKDGVHYATGFCGSGVVWARWFGRKAALKILGDPAAKSAFDNQPFRAIPFYNGNPWFLPATIAWYKTLDLLGR